MPRSVFQPGTCDSFKYFTAYSYLSSISILNLNISCLACINRWGIVIIYLAIISLILKKTNENKLQFFHKALLIIAVLYLISPTQFPWYYTWIVPLLVVRPKASLLLYPMLLPLYQLKYLADFIIYIEHLPILLLFMLEMKGIIWKECFNFNNISEGTKINISWYGIATWFIYIAFVLLVVNWLQDQTELKN